jgi:hypothetical protein
MNTISKNIQFLIVLSTIGTFLLSAGFATADQTAVLRVVDQHGQEIPASVVRILGQNVPTGSSISLPEGIHAFGVYPGLGGYLSFSLLSRTESNEVTATTTEISFEWITSTYTIQIQDQYGVDIPGSKFSAIPSLLLDAGDPVTRPITDENIYPTMTGSYKNGYGANVHPGLGGYVSTSLLRRQTTVENTTIHDEHLVEWITSTYTIRIQDQYGVDIPGSKFSAVPSVLLDAGDPVTRPITDENIYPTMTGSYKNGYGANVHPGLGGYVSTSLLRRQTTVENTTIHDEHLVEWITSTYTIRIQDQYGVDIPGSRFSAIPSLLLDAGNPVTRPITDENIYPTMTGSYKNGYGANVYPGLGGHVSTSLLYRQTTVENTTAHDEHVVEWIQIECNLQVRNVNYEPVPDSSLVLPWPFLPHIHGVVTAFPVNDAATYPTLFGAYTSGYSITVTPGGIGISETIAFKMLASGAFDPSIFEIAGNTYRLGCGIPDADGDGVPDDEDACVNSDMNPTVVIDGCDSGVPNHLLENGCTISDLIAECAANAASHGEFVSCVADLTNDLRAAGFITGNEKGQIQQCAAQADLP